MSNRRSPFILNDSEFVPYATLGLSRLYGVTEDGAVSETSVAMDLEELRVPVPKDVRHDYEHASLLINDQGRALTLVPGAGCILGRPRAGKTLLTSTLAQYNPDDIRVLRFREPEADSLAYERDLVAMLWKALHEKAAVIVIDSLRTTFYASTGATGRGGVNMGIFALLTMFDLIARDFRKVLLFTLNPMTTDDSAMEFYLDAVRGSVTHAIHAVEPGLFSISSRDETQRGDQRMKYSKQPTRGLYKNSDDKVETGPVRLRGDDYSLSNLYK